jgi:hypothetical protein
LDSRVTQNHIQPSIRLYPNIDDSMMSQRI